MMAIRINNARVDWAGYEFGRIISGELIEIGDLNELRGNLDGGVIKFRAVYKSEWMDTIERATGALPET